MDPLNKELVCSYSGLINGNEITMTLRGDGGLKNFRAAKKGKYTYVFILYLPMPQSDGQYSRKLGEGGFLNTYVS
jgi:hypothetical protein